MLVLVITILLVIILTTVGILIILAAAFNQKITELERSCRKNEELEQALRNAGKRYKDFEELAGIDPLTGVLNRRNLEKLFPAIWERKKLEEKPIAVIMADIDNLKPINDNYGHEAGDECLRNVAQTIKNVLRVTDVIIRWGGDEFLIILPDISVHKANIIAQRMQKTVYASLGQGISVGIAWGVPGEVFKSLNEMIRGADKQMYINKKSRKNS